HRSPVSDADTPPFVVDARTSPATSRTDTPPFIACTSIRPSTPSTVMPPLCVSASRFVLRGTVISKLTDHHWYRRFDGPSAYRRSPSVTILISFASASASFLVSALVDISSLT